MKVSGNMTSIPQSPALYLVGYINQFLSAVLGVHITEMVGERVHRWPDYLHDPVYFLISARYKIFVCHAWRAREEAEGLCPCDIEDVDRGNAILRAKFR